MVKPDILNSNEKSVNTLEISPRDVLKLLNKLGIKNVTAPELKQFVLDLKRLIAYDIEQSNKQYTNSNFPCAESPERPYSNPTISSKSKMVKKPQTEYSKKTHSSNNIRSLPQNKHEYLKTNKITKIEDKNKSEIPVTPVPITKTFRKMKSSSNFIKVPVSDYNKKSDPVSLYNYYSTLWQKYKSNLPGENSWAELRWSVRQKMLGENQTKNTKKTTNLSEEDLAKRREGWIS